MKVNTHTSEITVTREPNGRLYGPELKILITKEDDPKSLEMVIYITPEGLNIRYCDPNLPVIISDSSYDKKYKLRYPWKREEKKVE